MDETSTSSHQDSTQNKTRDSITTELESISTNYKKQMLETSTLIETKYQKIITEINKKLKSEKSKNQNLLSEIEANKATVENTKKLENQLQANSLILKSTKSELNIAECKLEKVCILEKQRETDLFRIRNEIEKIEEKNEGLKILLNDRENLLKNLENKIQKAERDLKTEKESSKILMKNCDDKIITMRKEMHSQCIEMQEDVTVLSNRLQEMSEISEKLELTKSELFQTKQEGNMLAKTVLELKDKLCYEIAKNENFQENEVNFHEEISELNKRIGNEKIGKEKMEQEKIFEIEGLKMEVLKMKEEYENERNEVRNLEAKLDGKNVEIGEIEGKLEAESQNKWAVETQNERLNQQLKDSRLQTFEISKSCEKKDKTIQMLNLELSKSETDSSNLQKMYKEKVNFVQNLEKSVEDQKSKYKDLESELESQKLKFQSELEESNKLFLNSLQESEKSLQDTQNLLQTAQNTLETTKNSLETTKKQLETSNLEKSSLQSKNNELTSQLTSLEKTEVNVCALEIKNKQLIEEKESFQSVRKSLENRLAEKCSMLEQAEHDLKRSNRKFDFTIDEFEQLKVQFEKERGKFEVATRDNIQLQDQVTFLRGESDSLKIQLQEAECKSSKSLSKSDRMKEKIKVYQKNLSEAHGEEMDELNRTIRCLTEKLERKEKELRTKDDKSRKLKFSENLDSEKVTSTVTEKVARNVSEKVTRNVPEKVTRNVPEKVTRNIPEVTRNLPEKVTRNVPEKVTRNFPEKSTQNLPEKSTATDSQNLAEINKKLEKLEKEKLDLQNELDRTLNCEKRVSDVEKRKRIDCLDDNKENIDPNAKKSGKKQRVVLGEKTNVQVPVKRSTRARKGAGHNKTMF